MRHRKSGRTLGRNTSHRKAMMRNMVTSFFNHEKITTTDARAKELRKMAEKLITLARRGDLHSRRLVLQVISDKKIPLLFDGNAVTRNIDDFIKMLKDLYARYGQGRHGRLCELGPKTLR